MSGTTEIRAALLTQLTAAAPGAAVPTASIAWENKKYAPSIGTRFYRATFLPGGSVAAAVGINGKNRHVGVFMINIFDPKDKGDVSAQSEAERIVTCFKRGTVLTYSGVTVMCDRAYRKSAIQEPDWYNIPIVIEYRADVAN